MADLRSRLHQCFQAVFPNLSADRIPRASLATVPEWDSLAAVTLLAVIEEEFAIAFAAEELDQLTSFELILSQLQAQGCAA